MKIGVTLGYDTHVEKNFEWCGANGIFTCQLAVGVSQLTEENAARILALCETYKMTITALVGCWTGPAAWNFTAGPATLGIVPTAYRFQRMQELVQCADFAKKIKVSDVCTHMGFIPENPNDGAYTEVLEAIRWLANAYKERGLRLNFETGQETPITLLRVIHDVGTGNVGINFDPANFLMYGKANPIDAVEILGSHINGVHAKDGEYPTCGAKLGVEKPLGQGRVGIEAFVRALQKVGYEGAITIEREISGEQQKVDMLAAKELLESILR